MHFIWVGGDMPKRNRDCVATFAQLNPGWEINLWIDRGNLLAGARRGELLAPFKKGDKLSGTWKPGTAPDGDVATIAAEVGGDATDLQRRRNDNFLSLREFARANGLRLRNANEVSEEGVSYLYSQYRREMRERGTNFGAASDILRILILRAEGGVYLDTDVECRHAFPDLECMTHGALWSLVAQPGVGTPSKAQWESVDWWTEVYGGGDTPKICNSTIACLPGSAAIEAYRQVVRANYKNTFSDDQAQDRYYNMAAIRSQTIRITGPSAAREASRWGDLADAETSAGMALGTDELLGKGERVAAKFHKTKWRTDLEMRRRAEFWGRRWHKLKDEFFFPAYLIRDNFFHDWL